MIKFNNNGFIFSDSFKIRAGFIDILRGILSGSSDDALLSAFHDIGLSEYTSPVMLADCFDIQCIGRYMTAFMTLCEAFDRITPVLFIKSLFGKLQSQGYIDYQNVNTVLYRMTLRRAAAGNISPDGIRYSGGFDPGGEFWTLCLFAAVNGDNALLRPLLESYDMQQTEPDGPPDTSDLLYTAVMCGNHGAFLMLRDRLMPPEYAAYILSKDKSIFSRYLRWYFSGNSRESDDALLRRYFAEAFPTAECELRFLEVCAKMRGGQDTADDILSALPVIDSMDMSDANSVCVLSGYPEFFGRCAGLFPDTVTVRAAFPEKIKEYEMSVFRNVFGEKRLMADVSGFRTSDDFVMPPTSAELKLFIRNFGIENPPDEFLMYIIGRKEVPLLALAIERELITLRNIDGITEKLVNARRYAELNLLNNAI